MAIMLTVHVVETIWARRREGGLVAPYLVIDHNGQQQQTEVARAGTTTTAWNQKATFAYAPTSDLVVMAFDAGRHGGLFLGQAVVDIAAMLQEGRLHAMTPISSSTGTAVGHVAFEVELSTSSKALAASLDIPGLTLSTVGSKQSSKSPSARKQGNTFQDDHLFRCSSPFAVPDVQTGHIQQHAQQQSPFMQSASGAGAAAGSPTKLSQKLGALGHLLGLNTHKPRVSEGNASSPANPATPTTGVPGSRSSTGGLAELGGGAGPLLARRSMMRQSQSLSSSSSPSAPVMTASITAAHTAALQGTADLAGGAAAGASFAAASASAAAGPVMAQMAAGAGFGNGAADSPRSAEQLPRHSHGSDAKSTVSSSRLSDAPEGRRTGRTTEEVGLSTAASRDVPASPRPSQPHRQSHVPQLSVSVTTPRAAEAPLSPLRNNRLKLRLTPRQAPLSPQEQRLQQQRQIQRDLERLQQLALQETAVHPAAKNGGAVNSRQADLASDTSGSNGGSEDQLLQEFEAADAAGKEAILYRQLMQQQAEQKAGSAQLLKLLAAQQQQAAVHDTQLLATLASISPDSSPRHQDGDRVLPHSRGGRHYPQVPAPVGVTGKSLRGQDWGAADSTSRNSNETSGVDSSSDGSSNSSKNKYYPEVPMKEMPAAGQGQYHKAAAGRRHWVLPRAAAAAGGAKGLRETSIKSEVWQSCESGSEAVTPTSTLTNSAGSSRSRQAKGVAARNTAAARSKRCPGQQSRLQHTADGASSNHRGVDSYPVSDAESDSFQEFDTVCSVPVSGSPYQQSAPVQPAYRCIHSSSGKPGYSCVENKPSDVNRAARWCEHSMLDAVPYPAPDPVFPVNAVVVEPSAPMG